MLPLLLLPLILFAILRVRVSERRTQELIAAVEKKNHGLAQALINRGADVNVKTKSGESLLMVAAYQGDWQTAVVLEQAGAKADADTGLFVATVKGDTIAVAKLMASGANPNAKDKDGDSVLVYAVSYERLPIMKLLIEGGADVNARNKKDTTVLMWAASCDRAKAVQMLLEHGADVKAKDKVGQTVINYRSTRLPIGGNADPELTLKLLKQAGARGGKVKGAA